MLEKALAIAAVTVPIATAFIASGFANASARREANVRLTELAVGILRAEPTAATRDIREWAVDVVERYSEVPISAAAKGALADSVSLPTSIMFPTPGGLISASGVFVAGDTVGRYPLVMCVKSKGAPGGIMCDTSWVNVERPDDKPDK